MSGLLGAIGGLGEGVSSAGDNWYKETIQKEREKRVEAAAIRSEDRQEGRTIDAEGRQLERTIDAEGRQEDRQIGAESRLEQKQISAEGRANTEERKRYDRNRKDVVADRNYSNAGKTVGKTIGPDGKVIQKRRSDDGGLIETVVGPNAALELAKAKSGGGKSSKEVEYTHKKRGGDYTESKLWQSFQMNALNRSDDGKELNQQIMDLESRLAMEEAKDEDEQDHRLMGQLANKLRGAQGQVADMYVAWKEKEGFRPTMREIKPYEQTEGDKAGQASAYDDVASGFDAPTEQPQEQSGLVNDAMRTEATAAIEGGKQEAVAPNADASARGKQMKAEDLPKIGSGSQILNMFSGLTPRSRQQELIEKGRNGKLDPQGKQDLQDMATYLDDDLYAEAVDLGLIERP